MSPVATGKVFVFNTTNQHITVLLNGNPLPDDGSDSPETGRGMPPAALLDETLTLSRLTVPRSNATTIYDPVFAQQNTLQVNFQGVIDTYQISVAIAPPPGDVFNFSSSNNDLLLYIFYGYVLLLDTVNNRILFGGKPT